MNPEQYREPLIAYSKTLPETLLDDDRESVLLAYLDEMVEADIQRTSAAALAELPALTEDIQHDALNSKHQEESDTALGAAREILGQ